jgi:large subunit ribosomal protein L24
LKKSIVKSKNLTLKSSLSSDLQKQYGRKNSRIVKGDTVKIIRGEYKGVEGKVERVNTNKGRLSIEGVQREKIKGGNVKVLIHPSNVMISSLNLDDKFRKDKLENGQQIGKPGRKDKEKKKND